MTLDPTFFTKIFPIIMEIFTDNIGPLVNNRVYWSATTNKIFPRVIYQSQDLGGTTKNEVGRYGWQGLITIRVLDKVPDNPHILLATICQTLSTISIDDYDVGIQFGKPIPFPQETVEDGIVYTAAIIIKMTIREK